jgi:transposase
MALGRRGEDTEGFWVATQDLPRSPGHPFYGRLNELLDAAGFDRFVEDLCAPHYASGGRPSLAPGVYFRMLFVGYFEGIDSQRGIAWRCSDSLSLREFLLLPPQGKVPDHSTLTLTRQRLPLSIFDEVFVFVLGLLEQAKLLHGKSVAVDSSPLEANAAMKSIVLRATGETWKKYVRRLAQEDGDPDPSDESALRADRRRRKKRVSNRDWESKSDPQARITRMKDGRTRLAYKAEHVVDLAHGVVISAEIHTATDADTQTLVGSVERADENLARAGSEHTLDEVAADKGYHKAEALHALDQQCIRAYIAERKDRHRRRWTDKAPHVRDAVYRTRRRMRGRHGKQLQRDRCALGERSFAHAFGGGRGRRTWIRGLDENRKTYRMRIASLNLGVLMRALFGCGTPRGLQGAAAATLAVLLVVLLTIRHRPHRRAARPSTTRLPPRLRRLTVSRQLARAFSTAS